MRYHQSQRTRRTICMKMVVQPKRLLLLVICNVWTTGTIQGTSNANIMVGTGVPSAIQPATTYDKIFSRY